VTNKYNPVSNSIPTIIRSFKSTTATQINELRQNLRMLVWQHNYYEHIFRNEDDMNCIRGKIISNLAQMEENENNLVNVEKQYYDDNVCHFYAKNVIPGAIFKIP
jgi:septation ring formation regulator EzrA